MCKRCSTILQYAFMCHQIPERSFFFRGKQFPICARCTGITIGYGLGIMLLFLTGPISLGLSILLIVPTGIDGTGQLLGYWISNNIRRVTTGILGGISIIYIFAYVANIAMQHGKSFIG